jgi:hypothetical protein
VAKSGYKLLLLATTARNPARYKTLIDVILAFDGQILTNTVVDKIMFELAARKIYVPMYGRQTARLKEQLAYEDTHFSDSDTLKFTEFTKFKDNLDVAVLDTVAFVGTHCARQ